jgi:hypothetical protein
VAAVPPALVEAAAKTAPLLEPQLCLTLELRRQDQAGERGSGGVLGPAGSEADKPVAVDPHIVVNEGDPVGGCLDQSAVAGTSSPAPARWRNVRRAPIHDLAGAPVRRRVVDHQHLDVPGEPGDGLLDAVEAPLESAGRLRVQTVTVTLKSGNSADSPSGSATHSAADIPTA